jgi:hypothetical protein
MDNHSERAYAEGLNAIFRVAKSRLLSDLAAFGAGAALASGPGGEALAAPAIRFGQRPSVLPRRVIVHADVDGIRLLTADKQGSQRRELVEAGHGTFGASFHRNLWQIELVLLIPGWSSISLSGRIWPRSRALSVARAVEDLAKAK